jgi:hypothetical protein
MAVYLARSCPRCAGYLGSFCESWAATHGCGLLMAVARVAAIGSPGYSCEAKSPPCRSPLLVVHHIKKSVVVAAWRKKVARNAPKRHSSHLYRASLFVPVVAQPIQDMSEVSITHKTMGIRLPRLRCGAIGLVCFGPADHPRRVSSPILPLCTLWGWVAAA